MVQSVNINLRPFLRGHFHQAAFFVSLGACFLLVLKSQHSFTSTLTYSLCLISLLGISALYHRIHWKPSARMVMRRLDHAAIYLLIAGTMTPFCTLVLSEDSGTKLLVTSWTVAGIGILLSIAFTKKPKWLNALFCVGAGIVIVPYLKEMAESLSRFNLILIITGIVAYALGALAYSLRRPNFFPTVFGYHEVFHVLVLVGAGSHFMVIHSLV